MKATGVVRKIDELGRVVIPKEVRRTLKIRDGEPLEVYTDDDGNVILKKYSTVSAVGDVARDTAEALHATIDRSVMIMDRDVVVAVAGLDDALLGLPMGPVAERALEMNERVGPVEEASGDIDGFILADPPPSVNWSGYCVVPITDGESAQGLVVVVKQEDDTPLAPEDVAATRSAAAILGKMLGV